VELREGGMVSWSASAAVFWSNDIAYFWVDAASSKAYNASSLDYVETFGFRGEGAFSRE
jgi:hypothetical protein